MKDDSEHWVDVPDDVAELLRAGCPARPIPPDTFARSRRRVVRLGAVAAGTSALPSLKGNALALALGAGAGIIVCSAAMLLSPPSDRAPVARRSTGPVNGIRSATPAPRRPRVVHAAPEAPSARPPGRAPATTDAQVDTLAAELELLRRARASADASQGLALLDEHARRFPRGMLGMEREITAIEILERAGRKSEALARAEALRERARDTTYAERIDHVLRRLR